MFSLSHFGRNVAAALALFSIVFIGSLNAGSSSAQPLNRQQSRKLAVAAQATLQARFAERRHLQQVAGRACASHQRTLCVRSRAQLARLDAQSTRVGRTAGDRRGPIHKKATPPASGSASSGSSGSSSSGSSGSTPSASGSGSTSGSGTTSGSGSTSSSGSSIASPPIEPSPISESPAATSTFQPGIDSNTYLKVYVPGSVMLGAKLVRIEFTIETSPAEMESTIAAYAAKGIRVLLLATFRGTLPTPAQAQSLAGWAKAYGPGGTYWASNPGGQDAVESIEFGNETSYGYQYGDEPGDASYRERAENYARRFEEAAEAISATGIHVGLLAQADDWTGDWVNGMYAAVPDLSRYVAGWTIHPYHHWRSRLEDLLEQTAAHGAPASIPIDITEFGLPADNGRCLEKYGEYNPCMSYSEAASTLRSTVGEMRQMLGARLGMFILYQVRDLESSGATIDSEDYYGALQYELQPKGEYTTAVQELLAS
jgi:hypothetical protein